MELSHNMARRAFSYINFGLFAFLTLLVIFHTKLAVPSWLSMSGRLHPVLVHLPIGMFLMVGLIYLVKNRFDRQMIDPIIQLGIDVSLLSSLLSSIVGLFLSLENQEGINAVANHKWAAYAFCALLMALSYVYNRSMVTNALFGLGTIALMITGHLGGSITHGANFLFPSTTKADSVKVVSVNPHIYADIIQPIIDQKCVSCHKPDKIKGDLLLTDSIGFKKGGENGAIFIAGDVANSRLAQYMKLPMNDDHHMPPDGKVQLTANEISIIEQWIASGASFTKKLNDYKPTDSISILTKKTVAQPKARERVYTFDAASDNVIKKLQSPFVSIKSLSAESPALNAAFFVKSAYKSENLSQLSAIKEQLVDLSLINMPITNNDIDIITSFSNVEKLNLNGTPIDIPGFTKLSKLPQLTSLSVANTSLDGGIESLLPKFSKLKDLYVSNTKVTFEQVEKWRKKNPNISFHILKPSNELPKLPAPQNLTELSILKPNDKVTLKTLISGSIIKYTTDGTMPDSTNGITYTSPITLSKDIHIKAVTLKDKWMRSDVVNFHHFVAGLKPDDAKILTKPNAKYPGKGAAGLINVLKADIADNADPNWIGFKEEPFAGKFTFNSKPTLKTISVCYSYNIPSYIFPPTDIKLYGSEDNVNFKLIKSQSVPRHERKSPQTPTNAVATIDFDPVNYKHYKIEIKNPKIPDWHPGKGEQAWLFLDEIFFYD